MVVFEQFVYQELFSVLKQWWVIRVIVNCTLRNKLQWNFNQNTKLFIHKNASDNIVCNMAAILSRGRWVKDFICPLVVFPSHSRMWPPAETRLSHWQTHNTVAYLHLSVGPTWYLHNHVTDSLLRVGIERDVVEWRDDVAIGSTWNQTNNLLKVGET